MPEDMPDRMPQDMPEGMPDKVPECLPDRMPEDLPDRMPDRMSEDMPEDMPDRVPEDMPEHIAEDMPGRMPEDMPDRMPEDMPDKMPEDMSDRTPEDLPVTKRINVMVGITRSKVIEFIFWIVLPGPYLASLLWKIVNHVDFRGIPTHRVFEQRGPSRSPSRPFVPGCDDRKLSRACLRRAQRIEQQILQLGEQLFSVPWLGKGQG